MGKSKLTIRASINCAKLMITIMGKTIADNYDRIKRIKYGCRFIGCLSIISACSIVAFTELYLINWIELIVANVIIIAIFTFLENWLIKRSKIKVARKFDKIFNISLCIVCTEIDELEGIEFNDDDLLDITHYVYTLFERLIVSDD